MTAPSQDHSTSRSAVFEQLRQRPGIVDLALSGMLGSAECGRKVAASRRGSALPTLVAIASLLAVGSGDEVQGSEIGAPIISNNLEEGTSFSLSKGVKIEIMGRNQSTIRYVRGGTGVAVPKQPCASGGGKRYEHAFYICGGTKDSTVVAWECSNDTSSDIANFTLTAQPDLPPAPMGPVLRAKSPTECSLPVTVGGGLHCSVASTAGARLTLSASDFLCSNPLAETELECEGMSGNWSRLPECSRDVPPPCMDLYYTLDGSDPDDEQRRSLYRDSDGLELTPGMYDLRAIGIRKRRPYNKRNCICCCKTDCSIDGAKLIERVVVEGHRGLELTRPQLDGSPDITLTLRTDYSTFEKDFYQKPIEWRSRFAAALGLFHEIELLFCRQYQFASDPQWRPGRQGNDRKGDFRRVRGSCGCLEGKGCMPGIGSDLCISRSDLGSKTSVRLYIAAAGSCVGGTALSDQVCVSNAACGTDGHCQLVAASWQVAFGKLQEEEDSVMKELLSMGVEKPVLLHNRVQLDKVADRLAEDLGAPVQVNVAAGVVAAVVAVLVLYACRGWCRSRGHALSSGATLTSIKSKGRAVAARVREMHEESRLARHAQFAHLDDTSSDAGDRHSLELIPQTPIPAGSSLFATKLSFSSQPASRSSVSLAPLPSSLLSTTQVFAQPQTEPRGLSGSQMQTSANTHEDQNPDSTEDMLMNVSFPFQTEPTTKRRQVVGVAEGMQVELEYEVAPVVQKHAAVVQTLIFTRKESGTISNFTCKAAVPKHMYVQISPPSDQVIGHGTTGEIRQTLRLSAVDPVRPVRVRLRLEFEKEGTPASATLDFAFADLDTSPTSSDDLVPIGGALQPVRAVEVP